MRSLLVRIATLAALTTSVAATTTTFDAHAQEQRDDWLDIELGKSVVLETPRAPTAVAITDPEVANIEPLGVARKFQVQGTKIGTTDLVVQFGPGVPPMIYEITVHRDLSELVRRVDDIVEGEPPRIYPLEERIVVEGPVDDLDTLEKVALVARIYDENFVNLMSVRGDHQVQLEVMFAEVSRTASRELGLNVLWGNPNLGVGLLGPTAGARGVAHTQLANTIVAQAQQGGGGGVAGLIPSPSSGVFDIGVFSQAAELGAVMAILDAYNVGKILAQPTLVSLSGQQAEFLAGGEIPIPSPSGQGQVQIEFKEYGIKLVFVPTVLASDVVDVRVYIEVSEPDYGTTSRITGFEVPGFISRKGDAHLRIESGMTFAMAGLLTENSSFQRSAVPGLGKLPIVGALFRTIRHVRDETEVVIYVTPRLVRPLGPGEVPAAPGTTENNNPTDLELYLLGLSARPGSRTAEPTGAVGLQR